MLQFPVLPVEIFGHCCCVCSSHWPVLSARRHPAHAVSVLILHATCRVVQALVTKLRHRDTINTLYILHRNAVKGVSWQCNVMLSHWMRQVRHAHASNPDTLKKIGETKDKEKEGKKEKEKHQESKYTERSTNDKGRPKMGRNKKKRAWGRWMRNEAVPPRRCSRQNKKSPNKRTNRRHRQERARYPLRQARHIFLKTEKDEKKTKTQQNNIRSSRTSLAYE